MSKRFRPRRWKWWLLPLALLAAAAALWFFLLREQAPPPADDYARRVVLTGGPENEERNRYLREDITYLEKALPTLHKNLFANMTRDVYEERLASLSGRVAELSNAQVFIELGRILALTRDAHTGINCWDGYLYPLSFYLFGEDVIILNADAANAALIGARVTSVNGVPIADVLRAFRELIPHENESWFRKQVAEYFPLPVYWQGLGFVEDDRVLLLTAELDAKPWSAQIPAYRSAQLPALAARPRVDARIGLFEANYAYQLLPESKALLFQYNVCAEDPAAPFGAFVSGMMAAARSGGVERILIDLRANTGGNSRVFAPFTQALAEWLREKPDTKVRVLIGRATFSSGMFALYDLKETAPNAVTLGEATGGAIDAYGEVLTIPLPRSGLPIRYSTKYFAFSQTYAYQNAGEGTFLPDIPVTQSLAGYLAGKDEALMAALAE